jgi:hypothetical protein
VVVEGPHAAETRRERHVADGELRFVEQLLGEVGTARQRDFERRGAEVVQEETPQVAAVTPSRSARRSTPSSSSAPSPMRRSARDTTGEVPSQAGVPGEASGRHRRHGRNPATSAAAAVGK